MAGPGPSNKLADMHVGGLCSALKAVSLYCRGPGAFTNFAASRHTFAALGRMAESGPEKGLAGSRPLVSANSPTASRFMGVFWASDRQQWEARIWTRYRSFFAASEIVQHAVPMSSFATQQITLDRCYCYMQNTERKLDVAGFGPMKA